jgi:hypothetical protein
MPARTSRISGGVTVWATVELRADEAPQLEDCEIRMLLGHAEPYDRHYNFVRPGELEHRLTVNGVVLARGQTSTYFNPAPRSGREVSLSWQLPARTRETAEALLRCVALHWARRDPHFLVFRIHAVQRALDHWRAERRQQMTRAYRDVLDRHRKLVQLRTVGDDAHYFRLAPPPGPLPSRET